MFYRVYVGLHVCCVCAEVWDGDRNIQEHFTRATSLTEAAPAHRLGPVSAMCVQRSVGIVGNYKFSLISAHRKRMFKELAL